MLGLEVWLFDVRRVERSPAIVTMQRKLVAILSADVQGYSRLMNDDEAMTIRTLMTYRAIMEQLIQQHHGRVVDSPGDNVLAEFTSVVDAVQCAVAIQGALTEHNASLPASRAMAFRMGINLGDVVLEGEHIYGDGVNIAARLEGLATAGGICISGTVYEQVESKLDLPYVYLGEQAVKNMAKPIQVYRIEMRRAVISTAFSSGMQAQPRRYSRATLAAAVTLLGLLAGAVFWHICDRLAPEALLSHVSKLWAVTTIPAITVLPFDNLGGDVAQEHVGAGMSEDVITDLAKHTDVTVVVRHAPKNNESLPEHLHTAHRALKVRYVLSGSVRTMGHRVRVTAQLVDTETGHYLWANRYDRDLLDGFAMQDEIAQKIVTALVFTLKHPQHARLAHAHQDEDKR